MHVHTSAHLQWKWEALLFRTEIIFQHIILIRFILQTCASRGLARAADSHRISREMLTQAANTSHLCQSIVLFTQDRHSSVNKRKTRHIQCTFSYVTLHSWTESVIDDDVRQSWRHTICPELKMCHFSVNDRPGFVYLSTMSRSSSRRRTNELKPFTLLSIIFAAAIFNSFWH